MPSPTVSSLHRGDIEQRKEAYEDQDAPTIFESAGIKNFHDQILLNAGNTTFGMSRYPCC